MRGRGPSRRMGGDGGMGGMGGGDKRIEENVGLAATHEPHGGDRGRGG